MKMVIAMRTDLNMRKGKMIAQGAHAAMMAYLSLSTAPTSALGEWINHYGMRKICVQIDSEAALLALLLLAQESGVPGIPVVDAGYTEFDGPTLTCAAFGPDAEDRINQITGALKLL